MTETQQAPQIATLELNREIRQDLADEGPEFATPEANKAIVLGLLDEFFNKRNPVVFDELGWPACVLHLAGYPEPFRGREAVKEWALSYLDGWDSRLEVEEAIAVGDTVAVRWTLHATHKGEYIGMPATGRSVTFTALEWFRLVDGKCVEVWNAFDTLRVVQQIGMLPKGTPPRALCRIIIWLQRRFRWAPAASA